MAGLLHGVSPETAPGFARAEHDKARGGWDEGREAFWRRVVELLAAPGAASAHPAPCPAPAAPVADLPPNVVRLVRR